MFSLRQIQMKCNNFLAQKEFSFSTSGIFLKAPWDKPRNVEKKVLRNVPDAYTQPPW